jgi:hypothetical protein
MLFISLYHYISSILLFFSFEYDVHFLKKNCSGRSDYYSDFYFQNRADLAKTERSVGNAERVTGDDQLRIVRNGTLAIKDEEELNKLEMEGSRVEDTGKMKAEKKIEMGDFNEHIGVRSIKPSTPLLQCRDIIDKEMMWLIPHGVAHLQRVWEDENTHPSINDAVMSYTWERHIARDPGQINDPNTYFSSPYEVLMALDVMRRYARTVQYSEVLYSEVHFFIFHVIIISTLFKVTRPYPHMSKLLITSFPTLCIFSFFSFFL